MNYLHWDQKTLDNASEKEISLAYGRGYVFTRLGKGIMQQTRSVRIDLKKFALTSENRRILKKVGADGKTGGLGLNVTTLPFLNYNWTIGRLAKDFYEAKFGVGIMSANKIKEMLTDVEKSNFNTLLSYKLGYAICYSNSEILHYSFPFYDLSSAPKDMGLGMMVEAVQYAQDSGKRYIYLGSLQRPGDTYKLQFEGLEWFDGKAWRDNLGSVKEILTSAKM